MKYAIEDYVPFLLAEKSSFFEDAAPKMQPCQVTKPAAWQTWSDRHWTYMLAPGELPAQGWKIHLSAGYKDEGELLRAAADYLFKQKISFKFTVSRGEWIVKNSKNADRTESGKFITAYPKDTEQFKQAAADLAALTSEYDLGPYILSDKRYKRSNVYYRYGAFKELRDEAGNYCIRDEQGQLVPDQRLPYYQQPDFVSDPFPAEKRAGRGDFSRLSQYNISSALLFSNAGGIYLGQKSGQKYLIKEGRQGAGIDANLRDGFSRIKHEAELLRQLQDSPYVIKLRDSFQVWIHYYLVEDYLPAENLDQLIKEKYPFQQDHGRYLKMVKKLAKQLFAAVEDIHQRGIAIGDLQPGNVLLGKKGPVLIDFEQAGPLDQTYEPGLSTPGFSDLQAKTMGQQDWLSLYKMIEYTLLPVIDVSHLAKKPEVSEAVRLENLDPAAGDFLRKFKRECFEKADLTLPKLPAVEQKSLDQLIAGIKRGIDANIDWTSQRLIKGDIAQFIEPAGMLNIENGALGLGLVLSALPEDREPFKKWCLKNQKAICQASEMDHGLFTGAAGMGAVLYSEVDQELGKKLIDGIEVDQMKDLSLESGLAGIGLAKLSLQLLEPDEARKQELVKIAQELLAGYDAWEEAGLLTGKLGMLLYLEKAGKYLDQNNLLKAAEERLSTFLEQEVSQIKGGTFLKGEVNGEESYLPYLNSGSCGLLLVLLDFAKDGVKVKGDSRMIKGLIATNRVKLAYMNGLFDGFAGLMLGDIAAESLGYDGFLEEKLQHLANYLVFDEDRILLPGVYGLKNSLDLATGAVGLLAILLGARDHNWGKWLPVIGNERFLFAD
ncbi:class III lanthionine synthetase LanKC [Lactobacillus sp.]|uniref:class III lanthionine synthetase LanKC n=1 Tax=Lactobacillus sp. TaxID=1591 RepID=UPI003F1284D5